ncbi:hypothetical protein [Geomonas subterranea]|uniref:hypothetical protein n=1 Tax=Geomonas subterranea TaxID=2847989 RepID=UPI001CD2177E|nr:hypothetical protein [Geomonas fuzhouensis]
MEELKACRTSHYDEAAKFSKNNISVHPKVTDLSGFYDGSELIQAQKTFYNYGCMIKGAGDIVHNVQLSKRSSSFDFKIDNYSYTVKQTDGNYTLEPQVTILARKYSGLKINDSYIDKNIKINIKAIKHYNDKVVVSLYVNNSTKEFVRFNSIALYINNDVLSLTGDVLLELPPKTYKDNIEYSFTAASDAVNAIDAEISNSNKDDEFSI